MLHSQSDAPPSTLRDGFAWAPSAILLAALVAVAPGCGDEPVDTRDAAPVPTAVTLTLLDPDGFTTSNAGLVAYQDGEGAWTELSGDQGHYQATNTTGRYGLFVGCKTPAGVGSSRRYFATTEESAAIAVRSCAPQVRPLTVSGSLTNVAANQRVTVAHVVGFGAVAADGGSYTLRTPAGPNQLIVAEFDSETTAPGRMVRRDLGSLLDNRTEDVNLASGATGTIARPVVTGLTAADTWMSGTGIRVAGGRLELPPFSDGTPAPGYLILSPAQRFASDRIEVSLYAEQVPADGTMPYPIRMVTATDVTAATTLALPAVRTFPAPVVTETALTWSLPAQAMLDHERLTVDAISFSLHSQTIADVSPGYVRAPIALRLAELTDLTSWDPAWSLGNDFQWTIKVGDEATWAGSAGFVAPAGANSSATASAARRAPGRPRRMSALAFEAP